MPMAKLTVKYCTQPWDNDYSKLLLFLCPQNVPSQNVRLSPSSAFEDLFFFFFTLLIKYICFMKLILK